MSFTKKILLKKIKCSTKTLEDTIADLAYKNDDKNQAMISASAYLRVAIEKSKITKAELLDVMKTAADILAESAELEAFNNG